MRLPSIIAIYALFWAMSFFLVLPFRLQGRGGDDVPVAGQADGAPAHFSVARTCGWTTIVSALIFGIFYLNYVEGWIVPPRGEAVSGGMPDGR